MPLDNEKLVPENPTFSGFSRVGVAIKTAHNQWLIHEGLVIDEARNTITFKPGTYIFTEPVTLHGLRVGKE